jgi:hypothetical protein
MRQVHIRAGQSGDGLPGMDFPMDIRHRLHREMKPCAKYSGFVNLILIPAKWAPAY